MTQVIVNDIQLNVVVRPAGPALLLHGFTGSSTMWNLYLTAWQEFTTIAVDLLDRGCSTCPSAPDRYRVARCGEDLVEKETLRCR